MGKLALIASIVLHALILALMYVNFGNIFSPKLKDSGYMVFDYVSIGPKSKAPILSDYAGRLNKQKAPQLEHSPAKESKKQPSEATKPIEKKPKKEPEVAKKHAKEEAVPIGKSKKEKQPKKQEKKPQKKEATAQTEDKAIVNLRKKTKTAARGSTSVRKSLSSLLDSAVADSLNSNSGAKAETVGETLTATQIDLVRQTIRKCWHFPAGLQNAEDLVVDIKMELNQAGNVTKAEIIDKTRMENDSAFRIAAENAQRAVLDPNCNPLPLPPEKYNEWKELELSFNPKEMFE
jgi:outer membrane biosynthesis protein TonB